MVVIKVNFSSLKLVSVSKVLYWKGSTTNTTLDSQSAKRQEQQCNGIIKLAGTSLWQSVIVVTIFAETIYTYIRVLPILSLSPSTHLPM